MNDWPLKIFISVLCAAFLMISCTDNPSIVSKKAPTLPPATSLKMDFSPFEKTQDEDDSSVQSAENYSRTVGILEKMNTVVKLNMMIPELLLAAANNTEAYLKDNQWEWKYSQAVGEDSLSVRLSASREDKSTVNWSFHVTSSGLGLQNQLLFSGTSNQNGTEGTWSYYRFENATSRQKVSQVDWKLDEDGEMELKLEITSDRNDKEGDYIKYSADGRMKTAIYYNDSADETTEIQINADTNVGYFISPDYKKGNQSCWNHQYQDIACGEL